MDDEKIEPCTANTVTAGTADQTVRSVDDCFVTPALNSNKTRGELMLMYFVVLIFFSKSKQCLNVAV